MCQHLQNLQKLFYYKSVNISQLHKIYKITNLSAVEICTLKCLQLLFSFHGQPSTQPKIGTKIRFSNLPTSSSVDNAFIQFKYKIFLKFKILLFQAIYKVICNGRLELEEINDSPTSWDDVRVNLSNGGGYDIEYEYITFEKLQTVKLLKLLLV